MTRYAANTDVPVERSEAEIKRTLMRYGAANIAMGWSNKSVIIGFEMRQRKVRFRLPMPQPEELRWTEGGKKRTTVQMQAAHEQAIRQRYRALLPTIKTKLESIESGIESFDDAFMAHLMLPGGRVPPLLPGLSSGEVMALPEGERIRRAARGSRRLAGR